MRSDGFLSRMAVLFAVLAALLTARGGTRERESHEAITGWVFLLSASLSILLVAHNPFGLDEIQRLVSSSIIGATAGDAWTFAGFVALTLVVISLAHRRLLLCAMDPAMAAAVGMRVPLWERGMAIWLGLAVGFSMRVAGVLFTFGSLVLPTDRISKSPFPAPRRRRLARGIRSAYRVPRARDKMLGARRRGPGHHWITARLPFDNPGGGE